jgi:antitoxin VapB
VSQAAKLFANGRSQAVRLPAAFRFDTTEVFIRKDPLTGDVILSRRPHDWDGFLLAAQGIEDADDFLSPAERLASGHLQSPERDPLDLISKPLGH